MAERLILSDAVDHVSRLLAAYPNGGANAGDSYIGALASILVTYPKQVAERCCNPVSGVARETKFLPTVADLVAWCERETTAMRQPLDTQDRYSLLAKQALHNRAEGEYWQIARTTRESYDELKARHGENWGIKEARRHQAGAAATKELQERANALFFERECAAAGIDPAGGVSPSLIKLLRQQGAIT